MIDEDLSKLYDYEVKDYVKAETKELKGDEKYVQLAINTTVDRVHQSMEAFIHNMNTIHSRGGNQVVFSSINYGTDDSPEGRCIIREMLLSTEKGVGNGETPIFPIQIWKKKKGVNYLPKDRNYDLYKLACKVSAKRFFPNFVNLDASFNKHAKWDAKDPKSKKCQKYVFEYIKILEKIIEEGIENGEFYDGNVQALASGVFGVTCTSLIYRMKIGEEMDVQQVYKGFVETVVRGLKK